MCVCEETDTYRFIYPLSSTHQRIRVQVGNTEIPTDRFQIGVCDIILARGTEEDPCGAGARERKTAVRVGVVGSLGGGVG